MSSRKFLIPTAAALLAASAVPSHATLMISLADNHGNSATVTDNGPGDLANPTLGAILSLFGPATFPDFNFIVATGSSKPAIGSATHAELDLSANVTSLSSGTLTLEVTDTDFTPGAGIPIFLSAIGGTLGAGSILTDNTFMDCTNVAFGQGTSLSTQSFSGGGGFSGNSTSAGSTCSFPFSLTEQITVSLPGGGETTSFDAQLAIPEPASVAILGMGLLAFAGLLRRRA